ncbi:MAG: AAA family ATPase, partial [Rhodothermales bacterium]|nr:AAA family ATPase [Rhodothermales bacterium]
ARYSEAHLLAVQAQNRLDVLRRDRDRAEGALDDLERRQRERAEEAERVRAAQAETAQQRDRHEAEAAELRGAKGALDEAARSAETAVLEARAGIADADKLLRELRRLREDALGERGTSEVRLKEIETRLQGVEERVWDEYGVALGELSAPADFDPEAARAQIPKLREKLRSLGAVNELALESYEEEKERLDFLRTQQADLEAAEASLRSTIREINATASARFDETFEAVRAQFQRLFVQLFGENASADLVLAGDDPLEDDIEIRARPKGKKPSAITQLSGGEKTLTAIALLFAIYLVKPSPFCILDEVDAPLDDANIERFMGLIRAFAEETQFILVTHNKLTMEAADRMYGVTMQEEGVSKLVGVRFGEVLPEAA